MVTVVAATFSNLIDDDDITATDSELIIDQAIDLLNMYSMVDEDISNMTGTAGTKTLSVEGYERGAILMVARPVYYSFFKRVIGNTASLGQTASGDPADLFANPEVRAMIKEASQLLSARRTDTSEIEVDVG